MQHIKGMAQRTIESGLATPAQLIETDRATGPCRRADRAYDRSKLFSSADIPGPTMLRVQRLWHFIPADASVNVKDCARAHASAGSGHAGAGDDEGGLTGRAIEGREFFRRGCSRAASEPGNLETIKTNSKRCRCRWTRQPP